MVRGPQSALWGSDAIGGVDCGQRRSMTLPAMAAKVEGGSFGFRSSQRVRERSSTEQASLAGAIGFQRATGIDSFGAPAATKTAIATSRGACAGPGSSRPTFELGVAAIALTGRSQFDGYDPVTFEHTDTLDNSRNRLTAGRLWAEFGNENSAWSGWSRRLPARFVEPELSRR